MYNQQNDMNQSNNDIQRKGRNETVFKPAGTMNNYNTFNGSDRLGMMSKDESKEFIEKTIGHVKGQLERCSMLCENLGKDDSLSDNMKTIVDQFKWIKNSLNVINANISSTLV